MNYSTVGKEMRQLISVLKAPKKIHNVWPSCWAATTSGKGKVIIQEDETEDVEIPEVLGGEGPTGKPLTSEPITGEAPIEGIVAGDYLY